VRADDVFLSDLSVIENGRSHSDKASISDRTSVDDGSVSDGYIFTDVGRGHAVACVHKGVFLKIRSSSDPDSLYVAAKDGVDSPQRTARSLREGLGLTYCLCETFYFLGGCED
jgi:hypothetical protein